MLKPLRLLIALIALFLVLGTLPALADEGDEGTEDTTQTTETEESGGFHLNGKFAILFAEGFDASEDDLVALGEMGFGWGDLFKLNLYATVLGVPVEQFIAGATFDEETGEYEFAWGELKHALNDDQLALLEGLPRNFGQFVSQSVRQHGRDEHQPDHAGRDADKPNSDNKPDHAGKGGRSGH